MKYEMIFGDYKFANCTCEIAMQSDYGEVIEMTLTPPVVVPEGWRMIAMRRIIQEPKHWTVADQKTGKLPEVGCLVTSSTGKISEIVAIKNGYFVMFECGKSNGPLTIHGDLLMKQFKPIESPEEKAARLREEWCSNALDSASILSGMREYDLKRLGGYIGNIYDALLSGDLPVPGKE